MTLKQIKHTTKDKAYWKYILARNNLTQRQLARKLGQTKEWVNRVIGGHDYSPTVMSALEALEEAIHVS
jgi:transcriptional regulator with XRE-family HTH domain